MSETFPEIDENMMKDIEQAAYMKAPSEPIKLNIKRIQWKQIKKSKKSPNLSHPWDKNTTTAKIVGTPAQNTKKAALMTKKETLATVGQIHITKRLTKYWQSWMDGIDHINIYSKGKTELGRWMSNFSYSPICTEDGDFASIEGYWYWLLTGNEELRTMWGYRAKEIERKSPLRDYILADEFKEKIKKAIVLKAAGNPHMLNSLQTTDLPLKHYYVYGTKEVDAGYQWITDVWEDIRSKQFENMGFVSMG